MSRNGWRTKWLAILFLLVLGVVMLGAMWLAYEIYENAKHFNDISALSLNQHAA